LIKFTQHPGDHARDPIQPQSLIQPCLLVNFFPDSVQTLLCRTASGRKGRQQGLSLSRSGPKGCAVTASVPVSEQVFSISHCLPTHGVGVGRRMRQSSPVVVKKLTCIDLVQSLLIRQKLHDVSGKN